VVIYMNEANGRFFVGKQVNLLRSSLSIEFSDIES